MAKKKNKKSGLADAYAQRRKERQLTKKTITPFEVHVTKDKKQVMGRRDKNDRGLPGISRTKAIDKRKRTLLLEYKVKDKDNMFLDRRIGERSAGMTQEDRAMARFAAERVKAHKKSIFNLNDDEVLTHRGQSLMEVEKYEDPRSDEESDEDSSGKLSKKFVADAHFGGGVLSKPNAEKSRKDVIEQLIAESKQRKAERQKLREQTINLTEKLDTEWHDLLPLLASSKKSKDDVEEEPTKKIDDYDRALREMKFDARAKPTDKLKSEEEMAKEEKEKLEKLENERLARMKGFSDDVQRKHRSADDLDDFQIEKIEETSDQEDENIKGILKKGQKNESSNEEDSDASGSNEESEESQNEDDVEGEEDEEGKEDGESEEGEENGESEEDEEDEESEDDLSDLKDSDSSSEEEEKEEKVTQKPKCSKETNEIHEEEDEENDDEEEEDDDDDEEEEEEEDDDDNEEEDEEKGERGKVDKSIQIKDVCTQQGISEIKKATSERIETKTISAEDQEKELLLENARKELPYTYDVPETYDDLLELFKDRDPNYQSVIVERIIKCNPWKQNDKNKEKLLNLFKFLLQYLDNCAKENSLKDLLMFFQIFDRFCPHLYDLRDSNPLETKNIMRDILKEKHDEFENRIKFYPGLDTLILFKLVSVLYPTSDFRHPIVTPCLVFMSQILLRCKIREKSDITKGLFLCTLILEYTVLNKRWDPSAINFLRGVIYTSLPKPFSKVIKVIPPFTQVGDNSNMLVLENNHKKLDVDSLFMKMQAKDFHGTEIDDDFRIRAFVTAVNLLSEFQVQCYELDAVFSIFEPILILLSSGSVKRYPKKVQETVHLFVNDLEKLKEKKLNYLQFDKKKPKALRLIEPEIQVIRDGKRRPAVPKEVAERQKIRHKLKMEKKSAMREIRRDNAFLTKVRIKQQIAGDVERKRKVKEIFGEAAVQQSEFKKLKRSK